MPQQMSVKWMMENVKFGDAVAYSCVEQMWDDKLMELGDKFIESVKKDGVTAMLDFDHDTKTLHNGHHRLLLAWLLDIEFINVTERGERGNSWEKQDEGYPTCYAS